MLQIDTYETIYKEVEAIEGTMVFERWFRVDARPFRLGLLNTVKKWSLMFKQHLIDHVTNRSQRQWHFFASSHPQPSLCHMTMMMMTTATMMMMMTMMMMTTTMIIMTGMTFIMVTLMMIMIMTMIMTNSDVDDSNDDDNDHDNSALDHNGDDYDDSEDDDSEDDDDDNHNCDEDDDDDNDDGILTVFCCCSLKDLSSFIKEADAGLTKPVKEGDIKGLKVVMDYVKRVHQRQSDTDTMFEPLKQTIELLKTYNQEMSDEVYVQLQVTAHHLKSSHLKSSQVISSQVISSQVISSQVILSQVISSLVILSQVFSSHLKSSHLM